MTVRHLRSASPARAVPPLYPEGIVADRFRIIETIGVGGSATVLEAEDIPSGQRIALKAIPAEEKLRKRARREMIAAGALDHGAIVRLLGDAEDEHYIYVAFELVRGSDLAVVLKERRLEESEILRAVAAVCDALEHAHERQVIHRDVKPANILLREDGILKLTDFGIAQIDRPDATVDESLLGTLSYMSPEQVRGDLVTGATDVWSAALVAYEALTRRNPYRSKNPVELAEKHRKIRLSLQKDRPDLPSVATKMIDRALDPDNQRRPLPGQLRDALLRGAIAMERGQPDMDPSIEVPAADPRLRVRRRWLQSVPDLIERLEEREPAARREHLRAPGLATRALPHWPVALTAVGGVAVLNALPFYPTGWPFAIALVAAVIALRLPWLAGGLILAAALPLLGNLAFALVPPAAVLIAAWLVLLMKDGRRVLLPVLAPLATALFAWPLYPLAAGTSPRAIVRAGLGAAGAVAASVALALLGIGSPLAPTGDLAALPGRVAGVDDAIVATGLVAAAIGLGPLLLAVVWAALAVTAPAVLAASGRPLAVAAGLWIGLGTAAVLAIGIAVDGALWAPLPTLVGAGAVGIVIGIRARRAPAVATTD